MNWGMEKIASSALSSLSLSDISELLRLLGKIPTPLEPAGLLLQGRQASFLSLQSFFGMNKSLLYICAAFYAFFCPN